MILHILRNYLTYNLVFKVFQNVYYHWVEKVPNIGLGIQSKLKGNNQGNNYGAFYTETDMSVRSFDFVVASLFLMPY